MGQELDNLVVALETERAQLACHPVFGAIRDIEGLRIFMEWHVFAVWDFMSLVKRLQRELTCIQVPWSPPGSSVAARLINEIVTGEESDEDPDGNPGSHYELYLSAMREVGASTSRVEEVVQYVSGGSPVAEALVRARAPAAVRRFVESTISTCLSGTIVEVLGSFLYGRENVIPNMFKALLARWGVDPRTVPTFDYYLRRHIELDGDSHGPAAEAIMDQVVNGSEQRRIELLASALQAVRERALLWDALHEGVSSHYDARRVPARAPFPFRGGAPGSIQQCAQDSGLRGTNEEVS